MKVLITGDRDWKAWGPIKAALDPLPKDTIIIHGAARGADRMAGDYATTLGLAVESYPAKWNDCLPDCSVPCSRPFHAEQGPIRNRLMLDQKPDIVYAFHDNLAASKGTKDCVREAQERGIEVVLWVSKLTDLVEARTRLALMGIDDIEP